MNRINNNFFSYIFFSNFSTSSFVSAMVLRCGRAEESRNEFKKMRSRDPHIFSSYILLYFAENPDKDRGFLYIREDL